METRFSSCFAYSLLLVIVDISTPMLYPSETEAVLWTIHSNSQWMNNNFWHSNCWIETKSNHCSFHINISLIHPSLFNQTRGICTRTVPYFGSFSVIICSFYLLLWLACKNMETFQFRLQGKKIEWIAFINLYSILLYWQRNMPDSLPSTPGKYFVIVCLQAK